MSVVEINPADHGRLRVKPDQFLHRFQDKHLILLRAEEVFRAACSMPVTVIPVSDGGAWTLSGVTSLEAGDNLFIRDEQWNAVFMPLQFQSWPFSLERGDAENTVGVAEGFDGFSEAEGEPLFDDKGNVSIMLRNIKALLESQAEADGKTVLFVKRMVELDLLKSISVKVHYKDGAVNTIQGLHTIDEDRLNGLSDDSIIDLKDKGYLTAVYSLLISLFQFNNLIKLHNQHNDNAVVKVDMEIVKDSNVHL